MILSQTGFAIADTKAQPKEWSIFVYAAGDEKEVRAPMLTGLQSMEAIPALRDNHNVNLIVQHDDVGEDPNYRYLLQAAPPPPPGSPHLHTPPISESEVRRIDPRFRYHERNSGDPRTLKEFLRWGIRAYPARHYGILLVGHSWGIAGHMQDFHFDGKTYTHSSIIKNYEMRRVFEELLREERALIPEGRFDALLIDSCIAGQFEVAIEFKDLFSYFFASSIETPYYGLDYTRAFDGFIRAVNASGLSAAQMHARLEDLLRTMVNTYVTDHTPGGRGVFAEQEYTPVAVFALRSAKLDPVMQALADLLSTLNQTPLPAEFRRGDLPELDRLLDSDGHADLLQLIRTLQDILRRRPLDFTPASLALLEKRARALEQSLIGGTIEDDPILTRIQNETARGAWLHLNIDAINPSPERAACDALRLFTLLNRQLPFTNLPQFRDAGGHEIPVTDFLCEGRTPAGLLQLGSRMPQSIGQLFDLQIGWPRAIPAQFTQLAATAQRPLERRLSIWIDRGPRGVLDESALLSLPGMRDAVVEYVTAESPVANLRAPAHSAPALASTALRFSTATLTGDTTGSGLYVAEGHTSGTLYKHGLSILLKHTINVELLPYFDGRAPIEKLEKTPYELPVERYFDRLEDKRELNKPAYHDVDFYCLHRIRELGWADFLFGPQGARGCRP